MDQLNSDYSVSPGDSFGNSVVLQIGLRVLLRGDVGAIGARLLCECGTEYVALLSRLVQGYAQSCGCARSRGAQVAAGMYWHPLYRTWEGMLSRCERDGDPAYADYGGRGIRVCPQWHDSRVFIADIERSIGPRPPGTYPSGRSLYSLDRIDNDGNYEPGNLRWATRTQQARNRRNSAGRYDAKVSLRKRPLRARRPKAEQYIAVCAHCGTRFTTRRNTNATRRFCCKACKAAWRRASGADDVKRTCHQCGSPFKSNRYDNTAHCGQSCAAACQHAGGCRPR